MHDYGALFLGEDTCVSYGDKVIGTNHVLPTLGAARYTGGLWVGKYLRTVTYQEIVEPSSSADLGEVCGRAARVELFEGHARSGDARVWRHRGTDFPWIEEAHTAGTDAPMTDLRGRTALVTGGGSGLGAAIATSLHAAGADLVLVGRDEQRLQAVRDRLGGRTRTAVCDVATPASVDELRDSLADTEVSILVNNAGVPGPVAALTDIEPAEWDEVFDGQRPRHLPALPGLPAGHDRSWRRRRRSTSHRCRANDRSPIARRTAPRRWP